MQNTQNNNAEQKKIWDRRPEKADIKFAQAGL
jgi:hypothetical protein